MPATDHINTQHAYTATLEHVIAGMALSSSRVAMSPRMFWDTLTRLADGTERITTNIWRVTDPISGVEWWVSTHAPLRFYDLKEKCFTEPSYVTVSATPFERQPGFDIRARIYAFSPTAFDPLPAMLVTVDSEMFIYRNPSGTIALVAHDLVRDVLISNGLSYEL